MATDKISILEDSCNFLGLKLEKKTGTVWQIYGKYKVRYTPHKDEVFVHGTTKSVTITDPWLVACYAYELPDLPKVKRKTNKHWKDKVKRYFMKKQGNTCVLCGKLLTYDTATIDHKIPISKGGNNQYENFQLTHFECNLKKGDL
jgi:hypothetical protein